MRTFDLFRDVDASGVSGAGHVGWAVVYPHGLCVVSFRDDISAGVMSAAVYQSLDDAIKIHGHGGQTRFVDTSTTIEVGGGKDRDAGAVCAQMDMWEVGRPVSWAQLGAGQSEAWRAGYADIARHLFGRGWRASARGREE